MKLIKADESIEVKSGAVTAREYEFADVALNLARITIDGRYPEGGYTLNTVCDSIIYVVSGRGTLYVKEGQDFVLTVGDQVHIPPNQPYAFEGELEIVYAATPAWSPEQSKNVD